MTNSYARVLLIGAGALTVAGLLLTGLNMLLLGWSVYAAGYVAAALGLVAYAAANRARLDGWSWLGLSVLVVGFALGLLSVASIWSSYAQVGLSGGGEMLLPADVTPLGLTAEAVTWVGLALFALAARGARLLPGSVAWSFVAASTVGILAAFKLIAPLWWVLAVFIIGLALLWLGVNLVDSTDESAAEPGAV
jgi:hypothetical protein